MSKTVTKRRSKARKVFSEDDPVEFVRDTDYGRPSEPGFYVAQARDMPGWHWVKTLAGERFLVPARRLHQRGAKVNHFLPVNK